MNPEKKYTLEELFPLPAGMKLPVHKFGQNPVTAMETVQVGGQGAAGEDHPPLTLTWDDLVKLRLSVVVREDPTSGKLIGDVVCTDPAMLNKASAFVAVVGKREFEMIRKKIKLDQPDKRTGGCYGSAEFGLLKDAVAQLGTELGLVVFLLIDE